MSPWNWKLSAISTLLYTLAFNLTFFIQELFLVLPKALTPGLRATLYHNNHTWEGEHTLASLFQGTGALAIFLSGVCCELLLRHFRGKAFAVRLFLFWMAYSGLFMALPQVVLGAIIPQNDVGMAMTHLNLSATTKNVMALSALIAMPLAALWLKGPLLELAADMRQIDSAKARAFFIFKLATLPALMAIPLIILFRVPRHWIEVVMVPVIVTLIGVTSIQAMAWTRTRAKPTGSSVVGSIAWPAGSVLILLLIFQLLLRPGIHFY
jgi:hypothetical protein